MSTGRIRSGDGRRTPWQQAALRQHSSALVGLDMFTEATQTQSPELFLGDSLSDFLETGRDGAKGGGTSNPAPRADEPAV